MLLNLSSYAFIALALSIMVMLSKHLEKPLALYFVAFLLINSCSCFVNSYIADDKHLSDNILNLYVKLQYLHLLITSAASFAILHISLVISKKNSLQWKLYIWLSVIIYLIVALLSENVYYTGALYLLSSIFILMFCFVDLFFISLEKEMSYAALGSILLLVNNTFKEIGTCLHPTFCECDAFNIITNAIAVALIAKTIHHILCSTVEENKALMQPYYHNNLDDNKANLNIAAN